MNHVMRHGRRIEVVTVEVPGVPAKPKRPKSSGFVMVPNVWREQLHKVSADGRTYHVAMTILDKSRWSEWVVMSNRAVGITRRAKYTALKQLRKAGLVLVEGQKGRSPRVKALFRKG